MNQDKFVDEEAPEYPVISPKEKSRTMFALPEEDATGAVKEVAAQDVLGTLALRAGDRRAIRNLAGRIKRRPDGGLKGEQLPSNIAIKKQLRSRKELRKFYKKTTYSAIEIIESWIASLISMSQEEMKKHKITTHKKAKAITSLTDAKIYLSNVIQGKYPPEQRHYSMFTREVKLIKKEESNGESEDTRDESNSGDNQFDREEGSNAPEQIKSEHQA